MNILDNVSIAIRDVARNTTFFCVIPASMLLNKDSTVLTTLFRVIIASMIFSVKILRSFKGHFTYVKPRFHLRWGKTGDPGEKSSNFSQQNLAFSLISRPKTELTAVRVSVLLCIRIHGCPCVNID